MRHFGQKIGNNTGGGGGGSTDAYCIEFDGTPKAIDIGEFFDAAVALGSGLYECWTCILPGGGSGRYDFSDGYGGGHAMLRSPVNGNIACGDTITGATNASPIEITLAGNVQFITGDTVQIAGVLGNTAANGVFTITKTAANKFTLNGTTGSGAYTSGGVASGSAAFGSTGSVSFQAHDTAYDNQWHYSATCVWVGDAPARTSWVIQFYDGVAVGATPFTGNRVASSISPNWHGYIGGSDHSNAIQRVSQYRIFEGNVNPLVPGPANYFRNPFVSFAPEMIFGGQWPRQDHRASFLCDFFSGGGQVADKGQGYPVGTLHSGSPRGLVNGVLSPINTDPPSFVVDATMPDPFNAVQPAGKTYTPVAAPGGALVFDSIQRKNSTLSFNGIGGLGSTESGSKGGLVWNQTLLGAPYSFYPLGILNEQFVYLSSTQQYYGGSAWVEVGQAAQDIRVDRKATPSDFCGVSTSIMFRYKDDNNYWYAITMATSGALADADGSAQKLYVAKVVAGVTTVKHSNVACPASWTTLRVTTKADGTYAVYCDATSVASGTDSSHANETKSGVIAIGCPNYYGVGLAYMGLTARWRNFTVFNNP